MIKQVDDCIDELDDIVSENYWIDLIKYLDQCCRMPESYFDSMGYD